MSDEIKAKITIEADTSGADEAAAALEKLQGMAGSFASGEGSGGVGDALANIGAQAEEATKAIVPLGEAANDTFGSLEEGGATVSEVSDLLGEHQQALLDTGSAYEALQEPLGATIKQIEEAAPPMAALTEHAQSLATQIQPISDSFAQLGDSLSQSVIALPQFADSVHEVSAAFDPKQFGLDTFAENMSVFQDALANPEPFSMVQGYLSETGQSFDDFFSSIGSENVAQLTAMMQPPSNAEAYRTFAEQYNAMFNAPSTASTESIDQLQAQGDAIFATGDAAQTASENVNNFGAATEQANKAADNITSSTTSAGNNFAAMGGAAQTASKSVADVTDGINQLGGVGSSQYGPQTFFESLGLSASDAQKGMAQMGLTEESSGLGGVFSNVFADIGNFGMGFDAIMRPIMMLQMGGQIIGAVSQGIYDAAAIAEGPGAHSMGTFTGTVDALSQSAQQAGQSFSESFGQQLLPTLNAMNYAMNQGGSGGIGGTLGALGSDISNNLLMVGGGLALTVPGMQGIGMSMITTGGEGMINQGASAIGLPQPFQGPGPQAQAQISYDQQMAQLPQTVAAQTLQSQASAATLTAEAMSPAYLQAQDNASAAQQLLQRQQASYNAGHPVSPQSLIQGNLQQQYTQSEIQAVQNQPTYAQSIGQDIQQGNWGGAAQTLGSAIHSAIFGDSGGSVLSSFMGGPLVDTGGGGPRTSYADSQGLPSLGDIGHTFQAVGQAFSGVFGSQGLGSFFGGAGNILSGLVGGGGQTPTGGCFIAGTPVLMADGTTKPIEQLQIGERVLGCEGVKQFPVTIMDRIIFAAKQTYKLTFSDGRTLTLTDSHPLCSPLQGWKSLSPESTKRENPELTTTTLAVGDLLYTVDGVRSLVAIEKKQIEQVFNITVDGPHTYYANGVLAHNAKGAMTNEGTGTESVSLSHTFTASVTWEANNLTKQVTAVANWAEQGVTHAVTAIANWAEQGVTHAVTAVANWIEQGVSHAVTAVANWVDQNVTHAVTAAAQWVEENVTHAVTAAAQWVNENVIHPVVAAAQWAEENITHAVTAAAKWGEENLVHTAVASATWVGENLEHTFIASASWLMGGMAGFAEGTSNAPAGIAMIAEAGAPEVVEHNGQFSLFDQPAFVNLPSGAAVYPMQELSSSSPRQLASGTVGDITPITLPIIGTGGSSGMQTANISVYLDSMVLAQALGVSLSQNTRIGMGMRGY